MMLARLVVVAVILFAAAPAGATDPADAAKELYERGVRSYNLQDFESALAAFQAAYSLDKPEFLFNIAQCQRQLKQYEAAGKSYKAFLASMPHAPNHDAAARLAKEMEDRAAAASAPRSAAEPPAAVPAAAVVVAAAPLPAADRRRPLRLAGIGLTGLGAGLIAAGAVFAAVSSQAADQAWHRDTYDYDADQRRASFRDGAIATFTVGGVIAAAGVTLWTLGRRQ
jgi:tetratricopeptide (TPR) repeat protein